jgi:hypothetical protein
MSLKQIHELDKIVNRKHRKLKRELKILEIKKKINNKFSEISNAVIDTFNDIFGRFDNKKLAYAKRK